ncbi:MAG TPA: hypothetical protein PLE57_06045 [Methanoregulaceae archaeon]|nr:hypothetical protein [Methanoregulaceae archaeon]
MSPLDEGSTILFNHHIKKSYSSHVSLDEGITVLFNHHIKKSYSSHVSLG